LYIKKDNEDKLKITINTSIRHPLDLKNKKFKTREITITSNDNVRIKENFNINEFTKIIKGDIIIYYN
jgi:hypothetical protein